MSVDIQRFEQADDDPFLQYRALSRAAVASLVAGVASLSALLSWICIAFPVIGHPAGRLCLAEHPQRPDELAGLPVAKAGLALSALFVVVGPGWLLYQQVTEVPDGYERISYEQLQPPTGARPVRFHPRPWTWKARKSSSRATSIQAAKWKESKPSCWFATKAIAVSAAIPKSPTASRLRWSIRCDSPSGSRLHKLAGVFHVRPTTAVTAGGGVYYQLDADHLQ